MDAIDGVLVDLESTAPHALHFHSRQLEPALRDELSALCRGGGANDLDALGQLDVRLGALFAETALTLLDKACVSSQDVRAIGSHGQTVRHRPNGSAPFTLQIGDPNIIAERCGITTVADFRRRDMAAGGQGAPLVPALHAHLFRTPAEDRVVLNLGGISNITVLPKDTGHPVIGFDVGPANTLADAWALRHLGQPMDKDGAWGSTGTVLASLIDQWLSDDYFRCPPPKSTGPEYFNLAWLERGLTELGPYPAPQDVQATLYELTALSVRAAIVTHAPQTKRVLVCGGGILNTELMRRLGLSLGALAVDSTQLYGVPPQWVEAVAFAWLAQQTLHCRPGNLPSVTGASRSVILGAIYAVPSTVPFLA